MAGIRAIVLTVPATAGELASDRIWSAGASAIEERTHPGERVELTTTLGSDDEDARRRLGDLPADWTLSFVDLSDELAETWRQFAQPIVVAADLVIFPAWDGTDETDELDGVADGATFVRIEPGGAFGLGDHPTTQLSAAVVHELVGPGDRVLDVGCGSGVLSVIAAARGAGDVVAVDLAAAAQESTIDNAERNGVADRVRASTTPVGDLAGCFEVVVANILAPELVSMAADLRRLTAPGGALVVSGVLRGGYDHVVSALGPMRVVDERELDGWSAVTLRHQQG